MTHYADLAKEIAILCLSSSLGDAQAFVQKVQRDRLTHTEYVAVLATAATRIAGCPRYDPAKAQASAAHIAEQIMAEYNPASGDETLDAFKVVTRYMRYRREHIRPSEIKKVLLSVLDSWLKVWSEAETHIDPNWDPQPGYPPFSDPRVFDGQTPDTIADSMLRASYERHLAAKQAFLLRHRQQTLLRQALEDHRNDYVEYIRQLHAVPEVSANLPALAGRVKDPQLSASLRKPSH